jgi:hypothetical protein
MREASEAFLRHAQHSPGSLEQAAALRMVGTTCWFQGDYFEARALLELALVAYDVERDRARASRFTFDVRVQTMSHLAPVLWASGCAAAERMIESALTFANDAEHVPTIAIAFF